MRKETVIYQKRQTAAEVQGEVNGTENKIEIAVERIEQLAQHGFQTIRLLGQGAFSQVLLVKQNGTGMLFACKISHRQNLLCREADFLASADHPLFPRFCDLWEENGVTFLIMEYICGSSLEEVLRRRGSLTPAQTARVGMELAEGLRYLHQLPKPVLYRDLKPANVMIRQDGRIKLLDMGCVCVLRQPDGARAGTPGYAAPEQLETGGILTFASDVYGLGRLLEAMAGKNSNGKLARIICACTAQEPESRIPDMQGVMALLAPLCKEGRSREVSSRLCGFLQSRVTCVKSIWESEYKNL